MSRSNKDLRNTSNRDEVDTSSPRTLKELLSAVAVYAAGGRKALADFSKRRGGAVRQLTRQITKD